MTKTASPTHSIKALKISRSPIESVTSDAADFIRVSLHRTQITHRLGGRIGEEVSRNFYGANPGLGETVLEGVAEWMIALAAGRYGCAGSPSKYNRFCAKVVLIKK